MAARRRGGRVIGGRRRWRRRGGAGGVGRRANDRTDGAVPADDDSCGKRAGEIGTSDGAIRIAEDGEGGGRGVKSADIAGGFAFVDGEDDEAGAAR